MNRVLPALSWRLSTWLAVTVCMSAAALVWIGYRAVVEWEHAAAQVASRRAEAAVDLLVTALTRDMRGVQLQVLSSMDRDVLAAGSGTDLLHPIGSAFARYPYTEAFFSWRAAPVSGPVTFFARAARQPQWLGAADRSKMFPVVVGSEPAVASRLLDRLMKDGRYGRRLSAFNIEIAGARYQIVALLSYADMLREQPVSVLGFMVNLDWARRHYFSDLTAQVAQIEGDSRGFHFMVFDDQGVSVAGAADPRATGPSGRRSFPMTFFDPLAIAADPPPDLELASWTAVVTAGDDPTLAAAERGARRTLAIAAIMTLALTVALGFSLQAARASAHLAEMRSEFVSAVTHELKTPLANMRVIHETLASGRSTIQMSREYAQMGIREATRLSRLIDNLLAYARITDVADAYSFEPVALESIVERSLQEFAPHLGQGAFDVHVDLPEDLPPVLGDPTALGLMLNNLLDNAIRYSAEIRHLTIRGRRQGQLAVLEVTDKGIGIPAGQVHKVTRKFFRGHDSHAGGSGLGLAIVDRIVTDHGGALEIRSAVGAGTTVTVTLPVAS